MDGTVTRSWRSTERPGAGRVTGLNEMMGLEVWIGMSAAAPMRAW